MKKSDMKLKLIQDDRITTITTDSNRLTQIFSNLLSNAIKFTNKGEISFGIERIHDRNIYMFVKDSGIGISEEMQKVVFERFRQGEENTTRLYGGNGLGLSIVKNLVEIMGGEITLESEYGVGSIFRFYLPLK